MRYFKLETNQSYIGTEPHFFREDEFYEAIDNLSEEFYPIKISLVSKSEYTNELGSSFR